MSFADKYLQNKAKRDRLIQNSPDAELKLIVIIPAYNESGLTQCLDSLFFCHPTPFICEVIVLINTPANTSSECLKQNQEAYEQALKWTKEHPREHLFWNILYLKNLPNKHFGAGNARKIAMDEASRRFNDIDNPNGIIVSLDADTVVAPNYLTALLSHFQMHPKTSGCSIAFEHPIEGSEFSAETYAAIINYELYLWYYLLAVRSTGFPYAYHTVGSAFAVKASAYISEGGMSNRQAGEDFYFIQKLALLGQFSECKDTMVYPSPRPSKRVPFGTGPEIQKQLDSPNTPYFTYDFKLFKMLSSFYSEKELLSRDKGISLFLSKLDDLLVQYINKSDFEKIIIEINSNTASKEKFNQRFVRKFNMLWILKFLHFAVENGNSKVKLLDALKELSKETGLLLDYTSTKASLLGIRSTHNPSNHSML